MNQIHNRNLILRSQYLSQVVEVSRWCVQAMRSQKMKRTATHRNTRDKNCSSECCGVPGLAAENKHKHFYIPILEHSDNTIEFVVLVGVGCSK